MKAIRDESLSGISLTLADREKSLQDIWSIPLYWFRVEGLIVTSGGK